MKNKAMEKLFRLAYTDAMTDLQNRNAYEECLEKLRSDRRVLDNITVVVVDINDLKPDMQLNGTVRNVVDFGCFVDIGVHHDGLLHISEMSDRYIKHPSELFKTGDVIEVRIKDVDVQKHRISLTRKGMGNPKK